MIYKNRFLSKCLCIWSINYSFDNCISQNDELLLVCTKTFVKNNTTNMTLIGLVLWCALSPSSIESSLNLMDGLINNTIIHNAFNTSLIWHDWSTSCATSLTENTLDFEVIVVFYFSNPLWMETKGNGKHFSLFWDVLLYKQNNKSWVSMIIG